MWINILKKILQTLYLFYHCKKQTKKNYFFTIVFENIGFETLNLLNVLSQNYSFINLKKCENFNLNNDLEANFQLNSVIDKIRLEISTFCMLLTINPRHEGYCLNLNLKHRFLKGNFKCLALGSIINLTFPILFISSNSKTTKTISIGSNLACQEVKFSKNPIIILNNEFFKQNEISKTLEMIKYSNIFFNNSWNGFNLLIQSLNENGIQSFAKFIPITSKDLTNFSTLFLINVSINNLSSLKQLIESKLINYLLSTIKQQNTNAFFLDQNPNFYNNLNFHNELKKLNTKTYNEYKYLPNTMFYENEETFINTEGLVKRTTKLIYREKTKSNWQIFKTLLNQLKTRILFLNKKDIYNIFFDSSKRFDFKNFISFQYFSTQSITNIAFSLNFKTEPFLISNNVLKFKLMSNKISLTIIKYWLDDFFSGSKDEYSRNSLTLIDCSKILRLETTNFF